MSELNEKLAQEAAELINGGEFYNGKWYSDGHRDAWRRAMNPAAERIEQLEHELQWEKESREAAAKKAWEFADRIEQLEAALREITSVEKVYVAKGEDMAQALTVLLSSHLKTARAALAGEKKDDGTS